MSDRARMPGELIYEHAVQIEQVSDYGVALDRLLSGPATPPPEGARFDFHHEGTVPSAKVQGTLNRPPSSAPKGTSMRPAAPLPPPPPTPLLGPNAHPPP